MGQMWFMHLDINPVLVGFSYVFDSTDGTTLFVYLYICGYGFTVLSWLTQVTAQNLLLFLVCTLIRHIGTE